MRLEDALAVVAAASATTLLALAAAVSMLPPCEYEDSSWCYWQADRMGNGEGQSFISLWPRD